MCPRNVTGTKVENRLWTPKYVTSLISGESLEIPPKSSRYSQHPPPRCPRNVSGTKMKNRFLMMIFDDDVILDDDMIFDDDVMLM